MVQLLKPRLRPVQARFRERRRAKEDEMQRHMEELEVRVQQLQAERDALDMRAAMLQQQQQHIAPPKDPSVRPEP